MQLQTYIKLKPLIEVFVSFVIITVTDNHCLVCFGEASAVHKCVTCCCPVHIICGRPVGEEDMGKKLNATNVAMEVSTCHQFPYLYYNFCILPTLSKNIFLYFFSLKCNM